MDKLFTRAELVSFGTFLLSEERQANYADRPESAKEVNHADVENWLTKEDSREFTQVDTSTNAYMGNKKDIR